MAGLFLFLDEEQAMKKSEVEVGKHYSAKISVRLTTVKIVAESEYGGWVAVNTATGRRVRIRSAGKLRREVKASFRCRHCGYVTDIGGLPRCPKCGG